ncbi:MAG: hypothetical protein ACR65R_04630 [Methylomicrobium sp.]
MDTFFLKFNRYFEYPVYILFIFIYPFLFIRYGLDYTDGPFTYMGYAGHGFEYFNVAFLSVLIGSWWENIFGDSIISFRIFATLLNIISIIIPVFFLLRNDYILKIKLRYLALAVIFSTTFNSYILNYDTISLFFLSLTATGFLLYLRDGGYLLLLLAGVLTALVASARLPSIVVIFPVMSVLCFQIYSKKLSARDGIVLTGCYIITSVAVFLLLRKLYITAGTSSPQLGATHSLFNVLKSDLRDGIILFEMMAVLSLLALIYNKLRTFSLSANYIRVILSIIIVLYFRVRIIPPAYNWNISLFYSAIILWILLVLLYDSYHKNNQDDIAVYLFCIMLGFVPALGSDTGLLKLSTGYIFLMPVLLYKFRYILLRKEDVINIRLLALLVIGLSIFNKAGLGKTYEDKPISQLTAEVDHKKLKWIKTSRERKDQIESIISKVNELRESDPHSDFMFYGSKAYLFTYLTDSKIPYSTPFYMTYYGKEDEQRMSNYLFENSAKPYVFLIFDYPDKPVDMDGYLIAESLKKHGYNLTYSGLNYQIYAIHNK